MPRHEQILPISGPMDDNLDSEYLQSGKGQLRKRVNMRPDNIGDVFSNTGIYGTELIEAEYPETGDSKAIGWCNDNENEAIIWFVFNTNNKHCIYRYYTLTSTIEKVFFEESPLGFTNNTVVNAEVIDGRLYWNDNTDKPKSFNIQKAVNYTAGSTEDAYLTADKPFDEKIFPYIKRPPRYKPEVVYNTLDIHNDIEINFNSLRKKLWQVKYNYIYEDFQESVYSPISVVPLPEAEISATGEWSADIILNNALKINIDTGSNNVKSINIAVRDASNFNSGPFYVFEKIDKFDADSNRIIANDSTHSVFFLNNTALTSIDDQYGNAYFHDVPLTANDLILLDGKYISMSMPKLGYGFKETSLEYSIGYSESEVDLGESIVAISKTVTPEVISPVIQCGSTSVTRTRVSYVIPDIFYPNANYQIRVPRGSSSVTASYLAGNTEFEGFRKTIRDSLVNQLVSSVDTCEVPNMRIATSGDIYVILDFFNVSEDPGTLGVITTIVSNPSVRSLKRGQYHSFAIVYNDEFGRYNVAFGKEQVYIPLYDESTDPSTDIVFAPEITINSIPPEFAHTYRIAYIPNNSYTYVLYAPVVEQLLGTGVEDDTNGIPAGKYFLKINQAILRMTREVPNSLIEAYTWINGDRLRRWGETVSYEILEEFTRSFTVDDNTEVETGFLIDEKLAEFLVEDDSGFVDNIEIYRPNLSLQDKVFQETGDSYEILDAGTENRRHAGNVTNQSITGILPVVPAVSILEFGDVYSRARFTGDASLSVTRVEDNSFSDFYASSAINIGRGVVRIESKQAILKRVTKSENYIQNTELNRLNIFLPGEESYTVSEVYGDITRIIERGDTIKIIQGHKETSVYVGKNYAKDAKGGDIILATDNTFGSDSVYDAFIGSLYPRSVGLLDNNLYYFDSLSADFMRSATNGSISLSKEFGMQKYFDDVSRRLRTYSGTKDVITSFEPHTGTIYLSFIMGPTIETIAFTEDPKSKGFIFFAEFSNDIIIPEEFATYGDEMFSFENGRLWKHGFGLVNSFYGSARKVALMEFVTNQYPEVQKSFETISVDTDGAWQAEMNTAEDNNNPFGQLTRIYPGMFDSREGSLVSSVPGNLLKRDGVEDIQLLYSGNKMLGHSMKVSISSVNFDKLREVKVTSINQK